MDNGFTINDLIQISAKIEVVDNNNEILSLGTGTIVSDGMSLFVTTAGHCIKHVVEKELKLDRIRVFVFSKNSWLKVNVTGILDKDITDKVDFTILKIEKFPTDFDYYNRVKLCNKIVDKEEFCLFGYTKIQQDGRKYSVSPTGINTWHLKDTDIDNKGEQANDIVGGNSGAGIFFERYGVYYMVSYVKGLVDVNGSNSDIVAFPVSRFSNLPKCIIEDNIIHLVEKWESIRQMHAEKSLIDDYRMNNSEYYNNLAYKMGVIFSGGDQDRMIYNHIDDYEKGLKLNTLLEKNPMLLKEVQDTDNSVFDDIDRHRPRTYSSKADAYDDLESVRSSLKKAFIGVITHDNESNTLATGYANYSVANRLLICSLKYRNNDDD